MLETILIISTALIFFMIHFSIFRILTKLEERIAELEYKALKVSMKRKSFEAEQIEIEIARAQATGIVNEIFDLSARVRKLEEGRKNE